MNQGNDDPDINTLDNVTLHDLVVEMNAKEEDKERDSLDLKPKDFDAKDFDDWSKSFIVYLDSIAGGAGTPLSYVVRQRMLTQMMRRPANLVGEVGWSNFRKGQSCGSPCIAQLTYLHFRIPMVRTGTRWRWQSGV